MCAPSWFYLQVEFSVSARECEWSTLQIDLMRAVHFQSWEILLELIANRIATTFGVSFYKTCAVTGNSSQLLTVVGEQKIRGAPLRY